MYRLRLIAVIFTIIFTISLLGLFAVATLAADAVPSGGASINAGTLGGEVLVWAATAFGGVLTAYASFLMNKLAAHFNIKIREGARAEANEYILHAINWGAQKAATELAGRGQFIIKNAALSNAVDYLKEHHVEAMKAIGIDPMIQAGVERIKARIETAIIDPSVPTAEALDLDPSGSSSDRVPPSLPKATV